MLKTTTSNSASWERSYFSIKIWKWAYIFLSLIPPLITLILINRHGVNFPFWDQWGLVDMLQKAHESILSIDVIELLKQHNEHRIFIPRIIVITLTYLSKSWNVKHELFFSYLLACLTFIVTIFLSTISIKLSSSSKDFLDKNELKIFSVVASGALIFSTTQYENWLWGFQFSWFLVNLLTLVSILSLLFFNKTGKWVYFLLASACCWASSYSLAHGLFSWLTCLPMFLTRQLSRQKKLISFGVWILSFILVTLLYFWGYEKPEHHPDLNILFTNSSNSLNYYFNLLGGSFFAHDFSRKAGQLLFGCYLFSFFRMVFLRAPLMFKELSLPWLSLGLFPVIFSTITMVGRAGFGPEQALASRYTTVALLLPLALVNLWIQNISSRDNYFRSRFGYICLMFFLVGCLTPSFIQSNIDGFRRGEISAFNRYRSQACIELLEHLESSFAETCTKTVHPSFNHVVKKYKILEDSKLLKTSPAISLEDASTFSKSMQGYLDFPEKFDPFSRSQASIVEFRGWAHDAASKSDRKSVVFLKTSASNRFFAVGNVDQKRKDVADAFNDISYLKSGWIIQVPRENIPADTSIITAYMYNVSNKTLSKLNGVVRYSPGK